ncbi:MAG: thiolase family protein [Candidatus Thermoplasmatota archaeon]|nr:thiolase family protein [Candidatus Thermoplasmatota archaeon]
MSVIADASLTRFGKREETLLDLACESAVPLVKKYSQDIDFIIVSNAYSGEYNDVSGLNNLISTRLSLDDVPSIRVDNTSGSGGSSIMVADSLIRSSSARNVLVIGAEKMTGFPTKRSTRIIASLLQPEERSSGMSLPSLGAFMARSYLSEFGAPREAIARVAVKNHHNGSLNPYAQFQSEISLEEVMNSKIIADPLRIYEYCPISDGAVSLLLVPDENAKSFSSSGAAITGTGYSSSTSSISSRKSITTLDCVKRSSEMALRYGKITNNDVDVAELHDMTSVLEIIESEDAGFFRKGEGWKAVMNGDTDIGGTVPINTSGGLNSKGHPIGASGVAQAAEIYQQLSGKAEKRQVQNAHYGFSLSMAGFGNSATAIVYEGLS